MILCRKKSPDRNICKKASHINLARKVQLMKKYLKIVFNEWINASRDKRELSIAKELGYTIRVLAITKKGKRNFSENVSGFEVMRVPTRKYGYGTLGILFGRIDAMIQFVKLTWKEQADIISGHDYLGLCVGYLSNCFYRKKNRAKLIYDSHEFELYRAERSFVRFMLVKMIEGFLIKRADVNMMVSDSIADEVKQIYQLKKRPIVVRNIPSYWKLDESKIHEIREEYLSHLNIKENGKIMMYHGGIVKTRKIELSVEALKLIDNVGMIVLGEARDAQYFEFLKRRIKDAGLEDRIYFHQSVNLSELCNYVAAADFSIILSQKELRNLYYSLPNKFFENIQSMTPMITSDIPEMGKLIKQYNIGILVDDDKQEEIIRAINRMKKDHVLYQNFKENLVKAKSDLCWENERNKVIDMIRKLDSV